MEQVTTEFVYVIEHDFPFTKEIDHQLMVRAIRNVPELEIVRFNKRWNGNIKDFMGGCPHSNFTFSGMNFFHVKWSNNNHFTTKAYYDWMLPQLGTALRPPEHKMMALQKYNCSHYGQHMYGPWRAGWYLHHINGKRESYNRTHTWNNHKRCPNSTADVPSSVLPWVRCPMEYMTI
eukprot:Sro788_g202510.1 n/a (176) ;mRNA; r:14804-15331